MGPYYPVPPALGGAVEKVFYALTQALALRGHEVRIISRTYGDLPNKECVDGVTFFRVPSRSAPARRIAYLLYDLIYAFRVRRVFPDSDITITNSTSAPFLLDKRRTGAVVISVARYPKGQLRFYRAADAFHSVSTAIKRAVAAELPGDTRPNFMVPNCVGNAFLKAYHPRRGGTTQTVLYVGRIAPEKGIELVIRAFNFASRKHPTWKLRIIGPSDQSVGGGGTGYLASLKDLAATCRAHVEFLPPVFDDEQLAAEYANSDIFVYPSLAERGESFGLAPLEAMATGSVPIVSSLDCFQDFIEPGVNGLIFDHRSKHAAHHLAQELEVLMEDRLLLRELSRNSHASAERYSAARVAENLEQELLRLAHK